MLGLDDIRDLQLGVLVLDPVSNTYTRQIQDPMPVFCSPYTLSRMKVAFPYLFTDVRVGKKNGNANGSVFSFKKGCLI